MWKRILDETNLEDPEEVIFVCFGSEHCLAMINAMAKTLARYPDQPIEGGVRSGWRQYVLRNLQSDHQGGERQSLAMLFAEL
jgi:hypothetical protein